MNMSAGTETRCVLQVKICGSVVTMKLQTLDKNIHLNSTIPPVNEISDHGPGTRFPSRNGPAVSPSMIIRRYHSYPVPALIKKRDAESTLRLISPAQLMGIIKAVKQRETEAVSWLAVGLMHH